MVSPVYIRSVSALLAVVAIIALSFTLFRSDSGRKVSARSVGEPLPRSIDITLKRARFSEIRNGELVWELAAARVDYDASGELAYLSGIAVLL